MSHYTPSQVLILDSNRLTELPAEIGALTKLEKLCVSENALTGLPSTFGGLQSLTVLKLVKNKLSTVPSQIGECVSLEEIDLSDNYLQVQYCPHGCAASTPFLMACKVREQGPQLVAFLVGRRYCCCTPEVLAQDRLLTRVCLALDQELPESLGRLSRLKVLAADQNRIASVAPALFKGCTSLQTLALHENPITIEVCPSPRL